MPLVSYLRQKRHALTEADGKILDKKKKKSALNKNIGFRNKFSVLVDVVFDGQQVVAHSLEGKLMQDGRDGVKRPVQDDQL